MTRFAPAPSLLACLALLSLAPAAGRGHEGGHPPKPERYPAVEQYRPTPLPDRLVLTWSDDPAESIDITYRTAVGVRATTCQWIEASRIVGDHSHGDIEGAAETSGTSEAFRGDLGESLRHTVKLRGLEPSTRYAYRVGDGVNWSPWSHYTTASREAAPFTFLYFGDAQNALRALWSRVRREAHADAPRAAFALHAGDLVNTANSDAEWGEWHEAAGWINGTVPTVATPGNHEYTFRVLNPKLTDHWRPSFSFPENGPKGLEETCYWFDYQGARFLVLNSNRQQEEQAEWADRLLSELPPARWTIAAFHHPIYSAAKNRDNGVLRKLWRPVFEKHGVDLALTGHDHAYSRSAMGGPADAENVPTGLRGKLGKTVYVVSVSGPKSYPLSQAWDVSRSGSGIQLYQVLRVEHGEIDYRAYRASGELYDAFKLAKGDEGEATLIDRAPSDPEVRR